MVCSRIDYGTLKPTAGGAWLANPCMRSRLSRLSLDGSFANYKQLLHAMICRQFAFGLRAGAVRTVSSRAFCQSARRFKEGAANVKKSGKQAQIDATKAKQRLQLKVKDYKASNAGEERVTGKYGNDRSSLEVNCFAQSACSIP